MEDSVLVDTLIWASFFSKPNSPEKRAVDDLLDADRVALAAMPFPSPISLSPPSPGDWASPSIRPIRTSILSRT
jgi:hypothetical protein